MAKKDIVGGTTGSATAAGFNCDVESWQFDLEGQMASWRPLNTFWQKQAMVSMSGGGQFQGVAQYGDSGTEPVPSGTSGGLNLPSFTDVSLTLTAESGCTYSGKADITGVSAVRSGTDRMLVTYRFVFRDAPEQTWATS